MPKQNQHFGLPPFAKPTPVVVAVLAVLFGGTAVVMLLTTGQMWRLGEMFHPVGWTVDWLKHQDTPFDLVHVVFFTALAATLRLLLPRVRWWWLLLALGVLAAGTELSQFGSPDRTPRLEDARDDLIGAVIGLSIAALPARLAAHVPQLLWLVRVLIVLGALLMPWRTVVVWLPSTHPIHPSHLLFAAALAVRAFAWASGSASFRVTRFHLWLLAWLIALGVVWLAHWPATWPDWDEMTCPVPQTAWIEASWLWCIGMFLAAMAALVAESSTEPRFARRLLVASLLSAGVTVFLHGIAPIELSGWRSAVESLSNPDAAGVAQQAGAWVLVAVGVVLLLQGVIATLRGNLLAGGVVAVLLMFALQSGGPAALGTSTMFWMIAGLLAGTVAHPDAKRGRASQVAG